MDKEYVKAIANKNYHSKILKMKFLSRFVKNGLRIWRVKNTR